MSYYANLQIVIAMNELYLFNLRKQGQVRFKKTLYQRDIGQDYQAKKKALSKQQQVRLLQQIYQIFSQTDYAVCDPYNIARKSDLVKQHEYFTHNQQHNQHQQNYYNHHQQYLQQQPQYLQQQPQYKYSQQQQQFPNIQPQNNYHQSQSQSPYSSFPSFPPSTSSTSSTSLQQSYIDHDTNSYYSKIFKTRFVQQTHKIEQSIFFKCLIPVDKMTSTQLLIRVELMFSNDSSSINLNTHQHQLLQGQNEFKTLGVFYAKVRKLSPISTYLPISFDQFEGFTITGSYHTTIMEFRFVTPNEDRPLSKTQFSSYEKYLNTATQNFRRAQAKTFYQYYREFLERELFEVQQRHSDLIRMLNLPYQFGFIKMQTNGQMLSILNGLPIFKNEKIDPKTQELFLHTILQDFLGLKALIYQKWNDLVLFMTEHMSQTTQYYQSQYNNLLKERFKANVFSHQIEGTHDWTYSKYEDSGKKYEQLAQNDKKKNKQQELWSDLFPIQDQGCFQDQKKFIKIFEQIYRVRKDPHNKGFRLKKYASLSTQQVEGEYQSQSFFPDNESINSKHNCLYKVGKKFSMKQQEGGDMYSLSAKYLENDRYGSHESLRPSLSNIGKSSMVTQAGFTKDRVLEGRHIELGNGLNSNNENSYKKPDNIKNLGKFSMSTNAGYSRLNPNPYQQQNHFNRMREPQQAMLQTFQNQQTQANQQDKQHIIILVHGYQASRQDFLVLKMCLEIRFKAKVYISNANQGRTDDNVEAMGKRLAVQLAKYFENIQFNKSTKISFIGHSLGGIIIRSALGFLNNIGEYLYTYMSFSSPHLGYLYEPSRLVKAGLWFLNSWQGSKSMTQICMKDTQDLRTTYFYRLSENKALSSFKNIVLVSSSQDGYIPYESARVQKNKDILFNRLTDSISRNVILQMVDNILGELSADSISRLNVIFHIQDKNMDSYIGRTAHVKYLSDIKFIKMFSIVFEKFFH